jgi:hypothetical protein
MSTGIITILIIVALTRIYKIRKNGGITNTATEVFETGAHLILSLMFYAIFINM